MPFAALIGAPGSTQQAPAVADPQTDADVYNYQNNEWRGESVTPMAANIQWDVATRDGIDPETGKAYTPLIRMLYNEEEVAFGGTNTLTRGLSSCTPVAEGSTWYKESELKSCLGVDGSASRPPRNRPSRSIPTPRAISSRTATPATRARTPVTALPVRRIPPRSRRPPTSRRRSPRPARP